MTRPANKKTMTEFMGRLRDVMMTCRASGYKHEALAALAHVFKEELARTSAYDIDHADAIELLMRAVAHDLEGGPLDRLEEVRDNFNLGTSIYQSYLFPRK